MTLPAISRHLKVLEHAGLITRSRHAQWRPAHIHAAPLDDALVWMHTQKATWEARLERLDTHLRTTEPKNG